MFKSTLNMQKVLEGEDHKAFVNIFWYFLDEERKCLEVRKVLCGILFFTESMVNVEYAKGETRARRRRWWMTKWNTLNARER